MQRQAWWEHYTEATPVVIGHYWRRIDPHHCTQEGLFADVAPFAWHGQRQNVFCVDYSVGARAQARKKEQATHGFKLAALRWPERTLMFDDGQQQTTHGFMQRPPQPHTAHNASANQQRLASVHAIRSPDYPLHLGLPLSRTVQGCTH